MKRPATISVMAYDDFRDDWSAIPFFCRVTGYLSSPKNLSVSKWTMLGIYALDNRSRLNKDFAMQARFKRCRLLAAAVAVRRCLSMDDAFRNVVRADYSKSKVIKSELRMLLAQVA